jgi:hypothetical protein
LRELKLIYLAYLVYETEGETSGKSETGVTG